MRVAVLSDVHLPDQDKKAWDLTKKILSDLNLDLLYLLGDIFDYECLSKYLISPQISLDLQKHVDESIGYLQDLRSIYSGRCKFFRGNHECLSDDTEVLTRNGFKYFDQLTYEDEIASVTDEGYLQYVKPDKIHSYDYEGEMYRFDSMKMKCLVTPNHRLWTQPNLRTESSWKYIKAEDMKKIRYSYLTASKTLTEDCVISDDFLQLLAWFCTDGGLNGNRVKLYQSKEVYVEKIRLLLNKLNIDFTEIKRIRNITSICGKELKKPSLPAYEFTLDRETSEKILDVFPVRQTLPYFIYTLSDRQVKVFLETLIDANGSRKREGTRMLYGSSDFLDQIQALLVSHGVSCSKYDYYDKFERKQSRLNITYNIIHSPDNTKIPITKENYSGKVWCLSLRNEKFIIRYRGRCHVTGNSRLQKYLYSKAKRLAGLRALELPNLMRFADLDIENFDVDKKKFDLIGKLYFCHGDEPKISGVNAAKNMFNKLHENVIFGHFHRFDQYFSRSLSDDIKGAFVNGCLQNLDPNWANFTDWHQGFSVIDFTSSGYFYVEQVRFIRRNKKLISLTPSNWDRNLVIS